MNDNHSKSEFNYKPRWITPLLASALKEHPVIVLTGARQVGKSTLLVNEPLFSDWKYLKRASKARYSFESIILIS